MPKSIKLLTRRSGPLSLIFCHLGFSSSNKHMTHYFTYFKLLRKFGHINETFPEHPFQSSQLPQSSDIFHLPFLRSTEWLQIFLVAWQHIVSAATNSLLVASTSVKVFTGMQLLWASDFRWRVSELPGKATDDYKMPKYIFGFYLSPRLPIKCRTAKDHSYPPGTQCNVHNAKFDWWKPFCSTTKVFRKLFVISQLTFKCEMCDYPSPLLDNLQHTVYFSHIV